MDSLIISQLDFLTPEYANSIQLRDLILRKPLNLKFLPSDLEKEGDSWHLACWDENHLMIACLILKPLDNMKVKMRQVAVDTPQQGKGIGKRLVLYAEVFARQRNFTKMVLHARKSAVAFYLQLGYEIEGPEFLEVGIPHFFMFKTLI
jgi:predicted GNAT family N-acyltransferase